MNLVENEYVKIVDEKKRYALQQNFGDVEEEVWLVLKRSNR